MYTIVLFEKSPKEFHLFSDRYYHYFEQKSDSGLSMELLQKYIFIPLDIFRKNLHNKGIEERLDVWLAVLSEDNPEMIVTISERYPEFKKIYEEAYDICCNMEEVMQMFSKELYELDRNTVQYMIDEMQDTIDTQKGTMDEMQDTIDAQKEIIEKSIKNTLRMMQKDGISEDIIQKELMQQYQLTQQQAEQYFSKEGQ